MNICPYNYNNFVYFYCMGNVVEISIDCDLTKLSKDAIHSVLLEYCYELYLHSDEVMTIYGLSLKRRGSTYKKLDEFINHTKRADFVIPLLTREDKIKARYDIKQFINICHNVGNWYNTREDVLMNK